MKQEISSDWRFVYTRKPHAVIYLNELQKKFQKSFKKNILTAPVSRETGSGWKQGHQIHRGGGGHASCSLLWFPPGQDGKSSRLAALTGGLAALSNLLKRLPVKVALALRVLS